VLPAARVRFLEPAPDPRRAAPLLNDQTLSSS
jgi:two-component system phosphate regulon sensor histidine kinase PhoR